MEIIIGSNNSRTIKIDLQHRIVHSKAQLRAQHQGHESIKNKSSLSKRKFQKILPIDLLHDNQL